jgi:xylulokinase
VKDRIVLGVDSSTSATKVIAFDAAGKTLAEGAGTYPLHQEKPGWVEQDAEDWWTAFRKACHAVMSNASVDKRRLLGVGLTHQRFTFVPMDDAMRPLRRAILWNDIRCSKEAEQASRAIGKQKIFGRTGYPPGQWTLYKAMWLKQNEPELYAKIHKLVLVQDYLIYRLTGRLVTLQGACTMTGALDIGKRDRWAADIIEELGVRRDIWIEPILPGGHVAGHVTKQAAVETGLPEGMPVVTGAGDQPCGILGAGVTEPGEIAINGGTSCTNEFVCGALPDLKKPDFFVEISPSGDYIMENYIPSGGSALMNWYRNNFGQAETDRAKAEKRSVWEILYGQAGDAPAGNRGVMVLPFFQGANGPFWDLNARGAIFGLHTEHGKAHVIRGLMEGLAYESRREAELMEQASGTAVERINMYGGSARSDNWNRVFADVFNKPLQVADTAETTALGAAISAAVGCGMYGDFKTAAAAMVKIVKRYEPDPRNAARYEKYYQRVYRSFYDRIQSAMREIAAINDEESAT